MAPLGDPGVKKWSISIFTLKFRATARACARNFKVKIEIDHFGEGPGAYITYISFNRANKT